ncbi:prolyl oligopeptidase family serine peptidase [Planctomycetota bacterium]
MAGTQVSKLETVTRSSTLRYLLYLPKDYDQQAKHPVLLFLHGAGERGADLSSVKVHGPPKLIEQGKSFPFIVVSPQCEDGEWWDAGELSGLLDSIQNNYKVDRDRVYVTGLSMGGFGAWALALLEPNRFAAIVPICGGGNAVAAEYGKRVNAAIWAFHGAKDDAVPLEESQRMIDAMNRHDVDAKLTVYPETAHDSWTETYENEEVYRWLLKQSC